MLVKEPEIQRFIDYLDLHQSVLGALIGLQWKKSSYEELDSQSRFNQFLLVIKYLIILIAYSKPLILVIEDSYDIDDDTKKAFDLLTTGISNVPLVIFASCRFG